MLKLSGEFLVARAHGPAVDLVQPRKATARIDHRFDGKAHAGQQAILPRFTIGDVRDYGRLMEIAAQPVAHIFTDTENPRLCASATIESPMTATGQPDRVHRWPVEAVKGTLGHSPGFVRYLATRMFPIDRRAIQPQSTSRPR